MLQFVPLNHLKIMIGDLFDLSPNSCWDMLRELYGADEIDEIAPSSQLEQKRIYVEKILERRAQDPIGLFTTLGRNQEKRMLQMLNESTDDPVHRFNNLILQMHQRNQDTGGIDGHQMG